MTKFGWFVLLGIVVVLCAIGASVYLALQSTSHTPEPVPTPAQNIEFVLPPTVQVEESSTGTSTEASASTTLPN